METVKAIFTASPLVPLFTCVALGYAVGKIRIGQFELGGIVGTLFVAILIGQIGVETDPTLKTMAFALFIYSLGFVCGPQFFGSLGRATLNQLHLAVFCCAVVFVTVWGLAQVAGLDQGTAAGLLAGATTESASVGTAGEALRHLGLDASTVRTLEANIGVSYAVTYLFGFTLVVFFVSVIAPKLLRVDLKEAAKSYESELGGIGEELEPGQEQALKNTTVRVYEVTSDEFDGMTVEDYERRYNEMVTVQQIVRRGRQRKLKWKTRLKIGDRVALFGRRESIVPAGDELGLETADLRGISFVGETRDVVVANKALTGNTLKQVRGLLDEESRRGVYVSRLVRAGRTIELRPRTRMLSGDVVTLYGPPDAVVAVADQLGYTTDRGDAVDYVYLGVGIIVGILMGMVEVPLAGAPVSLGTGGGCLLSGLVLGWARTKFPTFGSLPTAAALHLRDFGLAVFVATVGLAVGPQALTLLQEKGFLLPLLAMVVVLVPLISSLYYAKYVLKMNPVVICGALAACLTCTAALNAIVKSADSETPVLGYTVPYAIANVILTLLGPVIVLTV